MAARFGLPRFALLRSLPFACFSRIVLRRSSARSELRRRLACFRRDATTPAERSACLSFCPFLRRSIIIGFARKLAFARAISTKKDPEIAAVASPPKPVAATTKQQQKKKSKQQPWYVPFVLSSDPALPSFAFRIAVWMPGDLIRCRRMESEAKPSAKAKKSSISRVFCSRFYRLPPFTNARVNARVARLNIAARRRTTTKK